jgi:hypothetical protein
MSVTTLKSNSMTTKKSPQMITETDKEQQEIDVAEVTPPTIISPPAKKRHSVNFTEDQPQPVRIDD